MSELFWFKSKPGLHKNDMGLSCLKSLFKNTESLFESTETALEVATSWLVIFIVEVVLCEVCVNVPFAVFNFG